MTPPTQRDPGATRFVRHDLPADAPTVAVAREEFARWLRRRVGLDETRLCDVVLAVNEALTNVAEFAYRDSAGGTCDLEAVNDMVTGVLTVTVSDRGRWREHDPGRRRRHRGRGIPLMRALADSLVIHNSAMGTSVCMRFAHIEARMTVPASC